MNRAARASVPTTQRGFTLLELVIALMLLGLMLPLAFAGLRLGLATWDSVEDRLNADNDQLLAHDFLRRQLERAQLPTQRDLSVEPDFSFNGNADRLQFVAPLPAHLGQGGMYRFELGVDMQSPDGDVVLTGGVVAYNPSIAEILAEKLGHEIDVPPHPQFAGALGAALVPRRQALQA